MEAESLIPDERTSFFSTKMLGHSWAYQKLAEWLANREIVFREEDYVKRPRYLNCFHALEIS